MASKRSEEKDERVALPLEPEDALRALLAVDPESEPTDDGADEDEADERG
jgi:hypothetical protein